MPESGSRTGTTRNTTNMRRTGIRGDLKKESSGRSAVVPGIVRCRISRQVPVGEVDSRCRLTAQGSVASVAVRARLNRNSLRLANACGKLGGRFDLPVETPL